MSALDEYDLIIEGEPIDDPIERLRFFLSLGLDGQDWLDVEPFIEAVMQQLAAALAAIKVKDALLTELLLPDRDWPIMDKQIADALAIQPDDSALKAWLGEPVAWLHEKRQDSDVITHAVKNVWNGVVVGRIAQYSIPLYRAAKE